MVKAGSIELEWEPLFKTSSMMHDAFIKSSNSNSRVTLPRAGGELEGQHTEIDGVWGGLRRACRLSASAEFHSGSSGSTRRAAVRRVWRGVDFRKGSGSAAVPELTIRWI